MPSTVDSGAVIQDALLERDEELFRLTDLLQATNEGRGRLVVIEGAPGIGKSRLLSALKSLATDSAMAVLSARSSELERDFPYGVVRQLLHPLPKLEASRLDLDRGSTRAIGAVLGLPSVEPGETTEMPRAADAFAAMHGLYLVISQLVERKPLLLIVDDAHWCDAASLRFMSFLHARLENLPAVVALAVRAGEYEPDSVLAQLASDSASEVIRPRPLSLSAVSQLVKASLSEGADEAFCSACHSASAGNPYLLRELIIELRAQGIEPSSKAAAQVSNFAPATVAHSVVLRLQRLGPDALALARAVSVLGDEAELQHAAALANLVREQASHVADELARANLLLEGRPLSFAHPVSRAAVYSDIPAGERARSHADAAALLASDGADPDAVAVHLLASDPEGDPDVVRTLRRAAAGALSRGASDSAVTYLERALREPPPPDVATDVMLELGSAAFRAGDPVTTSAFERGFASSLDPRQRAHFARPYAQALWAFGKAAAAHRLLEQTAGEVSASDPELELQLSAEALALARLDPALVGAVRTHEPGLQVPTGTTGGERLMLAALAYNTTWTGGSADRAGELAERALGEAMPLGEETPDWIAYQCGIYSLIACDRLETARRSLESALEASRFRGSALGLVTALAFRAHLGCLSGDLAEAEGDAARAVELAREQQWLPAVPWVMAFLVDTLTERGDLDGAEQQLEANGFGSSIPDHRVTLLHLLFSRARLRLARGDLDQALADLDGLRRRKTEWGIAEVAGTPDAALAAEALAAAGRKSEALEASSRALEQARAWGTKRSHGIALRVQGLAEGGERGIELIAESANMLSSTPARLEYARSLVDLGAALRRSRKRAEARSPLRQALETTRRCGALAIAKRAHDELAATGERLPRLSAVGPQSLTASERRVVDLAARGLKNREIAQSLFLTVRTVEAHLTSAYRKLDIGSRADLPRALEGFSIGSDREPNRLE